jgi:signal transduction histidine kinase/CheY-like chemotaxis protein
VDDAIDQSQFADEINFIQPEIKLFDQVQFKLDEVYRYFYMQTCMQTGTAFWIFSPEEKVLWITLELKELINMLGNNILGTNFINNIFEVEERNKLIYAVRGISNENPSVKIDLKISNSKILHQERFIECRISKLPEEKSQFGSILGIVSDITERKNFEEAIAKSKEDAEEVDRIKTIFLSNISHEIRTPMNAIIGFTELLSLGGLTSEKREEFLTIIKSKSKYLLSLVDDIAELSKFEAGDQSLTKTETNLVKLLTELHFEFDKEKEKRNKSNIDIFLKLPANQSITSVFTDSGRIHQILTYLLDNALKFTDKGYIQFGYEIKDNRNLLFFVKDTGIGIAKESQKYLFNRFRIKEETYDKKYSNTGLSLTISRSIVGLLGGKIHVESDPGKGSNFYFTIPIQRAEKLENTDNSDVLTRNTNWRNKVILVAEDDEVNYHFLEALFADTQVQLLHVYDGKQAVEICKTIGKIDLILMDIKMPEKSGYEAVKEIKKFRREMPIIAQTAYTLKEDIKKCLAAGCDDYVSKPIDIELIFKKINKYFSD